MAHRHAHADHQSRQVTRRRLGIAAVVTLLLALGKGAVGLSAHSLSLLGDAGHSLTDVAALALAYLASAVGARAATPRNTYGFGRLGILAALGNGLLLVVIATLLASEAIGRLVLRSEPHVASLPMLGAAAASIGVNLVLTRTLHHHDHDLNRRSAVWHLIGDALSSLAVLVAAAGIAVWRAQWLDPAAGLVVGAVLLASAWQILREAFSVLMEAAPPHIDVQQLAKAVACDAAVRDVHHVHVWSLSSDRPALSAHLVLDPRTPLSDGQAVLRRLEAMLAERFGIRHVTLQLEACRDCNDC